MSQNGHRPRAALRITSGAPSAEEAAAVVAAIERFLADTTPATEEGREPSSGWQRTALLEGIGQGTPPVHPWGAPRGWGALRT